VKALHLSTSDIGGGAARAAYRLHQGLQKVGVTSQVLVQEKLTNDRTVFAPKVRLSQGIAHAKLSLDAFPLKFYRRRAESLVSLQWVPDRVVQNMAQLAPDIITLHWVSGAFIQIETLAKLNCPLVWTLHDMWAFTGGCHYTGDCDRYTTSCGQCPQLHSSTEWDLSRWLWHRKSKAWQHLNLTVVTPSQWLADCARASSLFRDLRIEVIPNGLDIQQYRPIDQRVARELLHLPQDRHLLLFGSMQGTIDQRKGFHLLQPALQKLSQSIGSKQLSLVVFGEAAETSPELDFEIYYLGKLSDDLSLALTYAAADAFVAPSLQDNLPNTVVEAIACGTPCVAFNIGGMCDLIEHQRNGYLAKPYQIEDLAQGIAWVLESQERHQHLSDRAREKAEQEFGLEIQASRYLALYNEILQNANSRHTII
jgi:glycosyltransferase involved in cell wall biosynthesis